MEASRAWDRRSARPGSTAGVGGVPASRMAACTAKAESSIISRCTSRRLPYRAARPKFDKGAWSPSEISNVTGGGLTYV
jgi:hypothetical protein